MRKILMTLLCVASVAAFTACGPKGGKKAADGNGEAGAADANAEQVAEKIMNDTFNGEKNTAEAAGFWFKKRFNIPIADLTPDFEHGKEAGKYDFLGEERSSSYVTFTAKDSLLNRDEYIEYVKKVYAATAKAADGGINVYGFTAKSDPAEAAAEKTLETVLDEGKPQRLFGIELYVGTYSWNFRRDGTYYMVDVKQLEKRVNGEDIPYAARVIIGQGLQKSLDESLKEAEKALEDPEVQKQMQKALKDM
jgi:predicted small lipoprotein YifL